MAGQQRKYKQRIRSTQTLAKVFRAMELIAASRIAAARDLAHAAGPYDEAITKAVAALSLHSKMDHPLTRDRSGEKRVAILAVTADRGMAGAYSASILRATDQLLEEAREQGKEPVLYVAGRRAHNYYHFRGQPIERSWQGESDRPSEAMVDEIARTLVERFLDESPNRRVESLRVVFTRFHSMVKQIPEVRKILPLAIIDDDERRFINDEGLLGPAREGEALPLYEFEPNAEEVLNLLLPMYVRTRIRNALLQSAASELASRQTAMHTANDNAQDMIGRYTRMANAARQAEITTEITEIVSGADALSGS